MDAQCDVYFDLAFFLASMGGVWSLFLVWWCGAIYGWNRRHTRPLHKIVVFIVFFKALFNVCYACFLLTCPFKSNTASYLVLAFSSAFTLYYTFLFTVFILISKGYCVTRYLLDRSEITIVAMMMGAIYLGFSAYSIQPGALFPLVLIIMVGTFILTARYSFRTTRVMRIQVMNLVRSGIQDMVLPARRKLRLMQVFIGCLFSYFLVELVSIAISTTANLASAPYQLFLYIEVQEEALETSILFFLFIMFRPKYRGEFATMPLVDVNNPDEVRSIPPLIKTTIPGEDLTGLSSLHMNQPVIVITPVRFSTAEPFAGVEIGQMMVEAGSERLQFGSFQ